MVTGPVDRRIVEAPVGVGLVGRVVDPLDARGPVGSAYRSNDPAPLQYIGPRAGRVEKGGDALIVSDDLTMHAWAYRQMSPLDVPAGA